MKLQNIFKNNALKGLLILTYFLKIGIVSAQYPGCPNVDAGIDQTISCNGSATLTATPLATGATTSYSVSSISYAPPFSYTGGTPILVGQDDIWSTAQTLPFNFCFFGNQYNQIVIGANGLVSFDIANATKSCYYKLSGTCPNASMLYDAANAPTYFNSKGPFIFGPCHDINPSIAGGSINVSVQGTAPCRTYVVNYSNIVMYGSSCTSLYATHQIVLYEATNVVEVYIQNAPNCFSWGNTKLIGIQNAAGTVGYTPPGRNTSSWSTTNEAWRFTPNGTSNYTVQWKEGTNVISNNLSTTVTPTTTTTYTAYVEYTNCDGTKYTDSDNITVTVSSPTPYNVTGGGSYCSGASGVAVGLSNSQLGVNYQLQYNGTNSGSVVAGNGSALSFGNQTGAGTYTVVASNGCTTTMTGNAVISINPSPTAYNVTGGGSYCTSASGVSVGLSNSESGVNYQLLLNGVASGSAIAGTGSTISFGNQTGAGTYTVVATSTATCSTTMTGSVTISINPLPTAYNVTGGGSYCSGASGVAVGLSNSQTGVNYQLQYNGTNTGSPVAGTGSVISFGNQTNAGTYTIVASNSTTGCTSTMTGSVTISVNSSPTAYNVTGGGSYCAGSSGVSVGLSNSESGINYQLLLNGSASGSAVAGTGSALSFGNQTGAGTYTVVATSTAPCSTTMTGSVTISINPLPTAYNVTGGGSYCSGASGLAVGLSNSQAGVNYQLQYNGTNTGSPVAGTGSAISFGNQTSAGTYTVVASNSTTSCTLSMTGSVTISVNTLPTAYNVTGGGSYCSGASGVAVGLSNSQSGVNYQLQYNGANTGSPVAGTGSALSFGNQTNAGTYTIVASNSTTSCTSSMTGSATISINTLPTSYNVTGGGSYCSGASGIVVGLSNSQSGVNYQLQYNGTNLGSPMTGTGSAINFGIQTGAGTYTVVATNATPCSSNMSGSATISINTSPTANAGSDQTIPYSTSTTLNGSLSSGTGTLTYNWQPSASISGLNNIAGPSTTNLTTTTAYTLSVTDGNGCASSAGVTVYVTGAPLSINLTASKTIICDGESISLNPHAQDGDALNYQYSWSQTPAVFPVAQQGNANPSVTPTVNTTYSVTVTDNITTVNSQIIIIVNPKPTPTASNNGPVCFGSALSLDLNSNYSAYSWTGPNFYSASIKNPSVTTSATLTQAGLYTVSVSDVNGCTNTANTTVTIKPLPIPNLGPDFTVCPQVQTTLTANDGDAYEWSDGSTLASLIVAPASTSSYVVTVTKNGCIATEEIVVNIASSLSPTINPTFGSVCSGDPTDLTVDLTGFNYLWDNGLTTQTITVSPTTPTTYKVTVSDNSGCSGTQSISINVQLSISVSVSPETICAGEYAVLTAGTDLTQTYQWSHSGTSANQIAVNPNTTTTYGVTVTKALCTASGVFTVFVNPLPIAEAGTDVSICTGKSTVLHATGGLVYNWSYGINPNQDQTVSPTAAVTKYTVTVVDNKGCKAVDSVKVFVNPLPTVIASKIGNCEGGTLSLDLNSTFASYSWTGPNSFTSTIKNPTVTANATAVTNDGTYTVSVTDANSCANTSSVVVAINSVPIVNLGNDTVICSYQTITFDAKNTGSTYLWSPNSAITKTISPTVSGTYSVVVTNANNCSASDEIILTKNNPINSSVLPSNNINICSGTSTTISIVGGTIYQWNTGAFSSSITQSPNSNTIYTVVVSDNSGCSEQQSISVNVNALPVVNLGADVSVCQSSPALIDAQNAGSTYSWNPNGEITQTIQATASGQYSVTVTNTQGCSERDTINVTVYPLINASITPSGLTSICIGSNISLQANGGTNYTWSTLENTQTINPQPASSQTYTVTVSDAYCSDTESIYITVIPLETISLGNDTTLCKGNTIFLNAGTIGTSYSWSTGEVTPSIIVNSTGNYAVTAATSCGNVTDNINVVFTPLPNANLGNDTALCIQNLEINAIANYANYIWSNGDVASYIIVNEAGIYSITITDALGCVNSDTIVVKDSCQTDFFIPNAFSPNGDHKNETFIPVITNIESYEFYIYNRWGQQLFYTNDKNVGWDGKNNGKECECAVYTYLIKYKGISTAETTKSGHVTLLR
ncbi:MAG: gliding motility-associated C-terminal domain-containing protein [Bacteroidota bacterium]